ncbi:MAG: GumC family protein [Allosphingosinicella sp.]|uniref:GumC family protein n=1 Tax=Allosphingosinicella sp. TaxID=2823234 RepID=UPI00395B7308
MQIGFDSGRRDPRGLVLAEEVQPPAVHVLQGETAPSQLVQFYWTLFRRKWVVLSCIAVALLIGATVTLLSTPQYVASATLEISREVENVTGLEGVSEQVSVQDREFYETQYGLLRSQSLARSVAEKLNLPENEQFRRIYKLDESGGLFADQTPGQLSQEARAQRLDEAEKVLLENVRVVPRASSRLVDVRFESPDPVFSARVTNVWVENFMQASLDRRFNSASYAREFLERRIEQVRQRLEDAERQLVTYATQQGLVSVNTGVTGGEGQQEQSLVGNTLSLLNAELAAATSARVQAESRLRQAQGGASQESLSSPALATLRQRRAEASAEYARLMVEYEPGFPQARAVQGQIDALDQAIAREEARVSRSFQETYQSALQRENQLRSRVAQLTGEALDVRQRGIQYNIFQRDVDTSRSLYDGLLQRYKEIGIAGGVGRNNVAVVDAAKPPTEPSSPRPLLNMLLALILGGVVGVAAAFGLDQIDEGLTDPEELTSLLGLPLLGVVGQEKDTDVAAILKDPKSGVSEAYTAVRTGLDLASPTGAPQVIAVMSSQPSEGKSTSARALAMALARLGRRVLLVDADMRKPSLHKTLGLPNKQGLSILLAGKGKLDQFVHHIEDELISVLTAGPQPPSPGDLLSGMHLQAFVAEARSRYDHVVFDNPPVLGLADAPLISTVVDGIVFVVESRRTKRRVALRALSRLRAVGAPLTGGILTKFDPRKSQAGYGESYYYYYSYGRELTTGREAA